MAATIKIKNSSTAGAAPTASDLVQGELAVNVTDKRLYTENSGGTIVELGTNPSVPVTFPDGSASAPSLTNSGDTNTGMFFPAADTVGITTGGTERARVDSSGNVGLGVTPSAWALSGSQAVQVKNASLAGYLNNAYLSANVYFDSAGASKYIASAAATQYAQNSGAHYWYVGASGTAGNSISFTTAMTLDASGNLLVGATSATYSASGRGLVEINGSSNSLLALKTGGSAAGYLYHDGTALSLVNTKASYIQFTTNSIDAARIDSSGNLLVGVTSSGIANGGFQYLPAGNGSGIPFVGVGGNSSSNSNLTMAVYSTSLAQYQFYVGYGGTVYARSTSITGLSDQREKENIRTLDVGLNEVLALQPRRFDWKDGSTSNVAGFVAQEVETVLPDLVEEYRINDDGETRFGLKMGDMIPVLVKAIQELKAEFDAYKATHP